MGYAEGSRWNAFEAKDLCYIGGPHDTPLLEDKDGEDIDPNHASHFAFNLVFGCQTLVTGLFKTQLADGIMGMDMRAEAFWYQMFDADKMDEKKFSLCFSRQPTADRKGTEAGALTLGGTDTRLHDSEMVYTEKASGGRAGFFSTKIRKAYLRDGTAGERSRSIHKDQTTGVAEIDISYAALNSGGVIVDSGTTDTYLTKNLAAPFTKAFHEMTGKSYSHSSLSMTKADLDALPTILFQLEANPDDNQGKTNGLAGDLDPDHPQDVLLAIPPSHYVRSES